MLRSYFGRVDDGDRRARRRGERAIDSPVRARPSLLPDILIAVALGACAFLLRLDLPTDGRFHDDAWQVLGVSKGTISDFRWWARPKPVSRSH